MSIELKKLALELAAAGVDGTVDGIVQRATAYYAFLSAPDDAAPNDKPKTRRSKTDTAPADGAASEPSTPNASKLEPADEGNAGANEGTSGDGAKSEGSTDGTAISGTTTSTSSTATTAASPSDAAPSRDDAMTAAVKFSALKPAQGGGEQALADVLKSFGVERFSLLAADQYGAFIKAMDDREAAAKSGSSNSLLG